MVSSLSSTRGIPPHQILVIDDQPIARTTLRRTLEYYHYAVLEAADGKEALRIFHQHRPHIGLVLLDLSLPDAPGERVLAALRTLDPKVRVAVCTDQSAVELKGKDEFKDVVGVLRKPVSTDRLLAVVRRGLYA